MSYILTVSEITARIRDVVEAEFPFVWVRGQVTNLSRPTSGHTYFTLTDADAALSVVWFRNRRERGGKSGVDPLTGEVRAPGAAAALENGREALVAGRIGVYAPRGGYQLVAELVETSGVSDLARAFEELKGKLAAKGWFDAARKRPIPPNPVRVALVTAPQGAAVRDFLRLAEARGAGCEIRIYPSLVQGEAAPKELAAAIAAANADDWRREGGDGPLRAQVLALVRGGGSLEDLWAFNSEVVAEAVLRSEIPVVTGVGHEPDVSIADYVADRRFATPSAAAAGLWPLRADLAQRVDELEAKLARAFALQLERKGTRLAELSRALRWLSPLRRLERLDAAWRDATRRLFLAGERFAQTRRERLRELVRGLIRALGPEALAARVAAVRALGARADAAVALRLDAATRARDVLAARLRGLDPEGPLSRGYALVRVERTGRFLRSVRDVAPGDRLGVRTADGEVAAEVRAAEVRGDET